MKKLTVHVEDPYLQHATIQSIIASSFKNARAVEAPYGHQPDADTFSGPWIVYPPLFGGPGYKQGIAWLIYARFLKTNRKAIIHSDSPNELTVEVDDLNDLEKVQRFVVRTKGKPTLVRATWFDVQGFCQVPTPINSRRDYWNEEFQQYVDFLPVDVRGYLTKDVIAQVQQARLQPGQKEPKSPECK